ncbi:MAG: outer membrane protein assembly factor BamD [Gammaproteobacteria bacterium]|nr:outer membrane protein assembly factor BamD [Gammaproteobacteria bacterium]
MKRHIIAYLFTLITLSGCAGSDSTKSWTAERLQQEAKEALEAGNYETAIKYYEALEARYPLGRYAQQAQLDIIYAYYRFEEPESALAAADRFIKFYPRHPHVDYVYYIKGLVNFAQTYGLMERYLPIDLSARDQEAAKKSFHAFAELVRRFPDSKYSQDARQRMLYLRSNLAKYELHVADYYMRRKAYTAAANRAQYVIKHYQGTSVVPDALTILVKAYREMKLYELAEDALRVLKLNYPHHSETTKGDG